MTNVTKVELVKGDKNYAFVYTYHIKDSLSEILVTNNDDINVFAQMVKNTINVDINEINDGKYVFDNVNIDLNDIECEGIEQYF